MNKGIHVNRLTTIGISEQRPIGKKQKLTWYEKCICDCGNSVWVIRYNLTTVGRGIQSCGCMRREVNTIRKDIKEGIIPQKIKRIIVPRKYHFMSNTTEYSSFCAIQQRCNNPKTIFYNCYGGRGIKCEWKNFEEFIYDMGKKPSLKHSIDRIDVNGNYCKENCRWATKSEQQRNRRDSIKTNWKGKIMSIAEIAHLEGAVVSLGTINARLRYGWSIEKALFTKKIHE